MTAAVEPIAWIDPGSVPTPVPLPAWILAWRAESRQESARQARVLLIEDDPAIARMYQLAMRNAGLELTVAHDGGSGLVELARQRYQLVLLDLGLPGLHGFEVLDRVRAEPELGGPRVVIVSNFGHDSTVAEGLRRGALDFVVKSNVTPRELTQLVARWLLG